MTVTNSSWTGSVLFVQVASVARLKQAEGRYKSYRNDERIAR